MATPIGHVEFELQARTSEVNQWENIQIREGMTLAQAIDVRDQFSARYPDRDWRLVEIMAILPHEGDIPTGIPIGQRPAVPFLDLKTREVVLESGMSTGLEVVMNAVRQAAREQLEILEAQIAAIPEEDRHQYVILETQHRDGWVTQALVRKDDPDRLKPCACSRCIKDLAELVADFANAR